MFTWPVLLFGIVLRCAFVKPLLTLMCLHHLRLYWRNFRFPTSPGVSLSWLQGNREKEACKWPLPLLDVMNIGKWYNFFHSALCIFYVLVF
jgi:hypothetical protein